MSNNFVNDDKLKRKKEYYFRQYFCQTQLIKDKRELISELNLTKKEILENPVYLSSLKQDDMPRDPNVNIDSIVNKIIKQDEKIENIDNRILKQVNQLNLYLKIFEDIEKMLQELTENQRQVFFLTYRDKMRRIEVAYTLDVTERAIQYMKSEILRKADFIQED